MLEMVQVQVQQFLTVRMTTNNGPQTLVGLKMQVVFQHTYILEIPYVGNSFLFPIVYTLSLINYCNTLAVR